MTELNQAQGVAGDLGGYYLFDEDKVAALMRPSETLNQVLNALR